MIVAIRTDHILASHWDGLGVGERFVYREFEGGHEFEGLGAYSFLKGFL